MLNAVYHFSRFYPLMIQNRQENYKNSKIYQKNNFLLYKIITEQFSLRMNFWGGGTGRGGGSEALVDRLTGMHYILMSESLLG
jgi:hypothetical protein